MKKFLLSLALVLVSGAAMAQSTYKVTDEKITSGDLNGKTEATYIAIKNLSATNNYYFVGNTGTAPYSKADFSKDAVFVWQPVTEGQAGSYYLMKLDGTYMQTSSPKDFGTKENAAVFTTTNPTSQGSGSTKFNGDGDSQPYINGSNDANLVRFVKGDNWINVQNGNSGTPTFNKGEGGWTIHYVYKVEEVSAASVTYVYKLNGEEKKRVTIEQAIGSAFEAPAIPFISFTNPEGKATEDTTIEITCTQNLPFVLSDSYATAKWYYMTIRSNNEKYVSRSESAPYNNSGTVTYGADSRWAFTGNVFDGIKILNNGAGENYTLGYDNTNTGANVYMKEGETTWIIEQGNGGFLLRQSGANEYIHDYSGNLQFWNNSSAASDPGSAFIVYTAEEIESGFDVYAWKEEVSNVLGYVGGYAEDLSDEIEAINDFASYETFMKNTPTIAVNPDLYYRLVCVSPKDGNGGEASYNTLTLNGDGNLVTAEASNSNINQIFKFEDVGEGKFYLKNMNADGYLNKIAAGSYRSAIVTQTDACKLELTTYGSAQWKLKNSEGQSTHCLFAENHPTEAVPYACAGWESGKGSASAWYIIPANDIEIAVNEYATVYLPFAVKVENATAYAVESTNNTHAIFEEKADIPANEGAILNGNGIATLKIINETTSDWSKNMLEGSTISKNVTPEGIGYVLSRVEGNIGFYKAVTEGEAEGTFLNNANKAYLVVPTAQAEGIVSYSLLFGGNTTAIESVVNGLNVNSPIYDLSGRRVVNAVKGGLYIQNGKKFIAQ